MSDTQRNIPLTSDWYDKRPTKEKQAESSRELKGHLAAFKQRLLETASVPEDERASD